jgi:hypothetical protein
MLKFAEGNGMGSSCKYSYLSGACANKHVDSLHCVGESKCEFAGLNILTSARKADPGTDGSGLTRWLGLYCETHRRFHFPGGKDCMCMRGAADHHQFRRPRVPDFNEGL